MKDPKAYIEKHLGKEYVIDDLELKAKYSGVKDAVMSEIIKQHPE